MRAKNEIDNELIQIKKHLKEITDNTIKSRDLIHQNERNEKTNSDLFALLKYMIDENRKTTLLLKGIAEGLNKIEVELNAPISEPAAVEGPVETKTIKETPLSEADTKIIEAVQLSPNSMACAEDIRNKMNYRGKNAASARLNKLYKGGLLERYQLGKKVYYKYDAGKATNILIVSPPQ
jgi:uncharacterized membrane protein